MQYKEYNILAAKAAIMSRRRCNIMAVTANYETVMVVSLKNGEENVQKVDRLACAGGCTGDWQGAGHRSVEFSAG